MLLLSAVGLGLAFAGCGQSDEEKAKNEVCDARADIQKKVTDLQGLTLATATVDRVKSDVNAIGDDLAKIADAQDQLDERRKEQVQKANETFKSQLDTLTKDLGSSQSLQGAAQQLNRHRGPRERLQAVLCADRLQIGRPPLAVLPRRV